MAEKLNIRKQSISNYEKSKSYPTFSTLDKIADFFKATPVQLFGTSQDIELERSVLKTDEYVDKVRYLIKAVNEFEKMLGEYGDEDTALVWSKVRRLETDKEVRFKVLKPNKREVGLRLRQVKEELGLSFSEFGQLLGLKKTTIHAYVRGDNLVPLEVLEKVSILYGKPVEWFYYGEL
ncbi:Cro/CI family transcriptional regulator [Streptococcus anginosus]|nr:Cro/CI family transcriptional regulator [Streptococcus anginosus]VTS44370.1 Cro/CI family transcriptional regulator [Streptococcus anginosus]